MDIVVCIKRVPASDTAIKVDQVREGELAWDEELTITAEARTIIGSYLGSAVPARDIPRYAQLWREGRLPVEELISDTIALDDINTAMDTLADGKAIRQIIRF